MPNVGVRCHELRIDAWRIIYRIDQDAIIIADVFQKKSQRTPDYVIDNARKTLGKYDRDTK